MLLAALQGLSLCMLFAGLLPVGGVMLLLLAVGRVGFLAALPAGELSHPARTDFLACSVSVAGCILDVGLQGKCFGLGMLQCIEGVVTHALIANAEQDLVICPTMTKLVSAGEAMHNAPGTDLVGITPDLQVECGVLALCQSLLCLTLREVGASLSNSVTSWYLMQ